MKCHKFAKYATDLPTMCPRILLSGPAGSYKFLSVLFKIFAIFLSLLVFWILMIHYCKLLVGSEIYQETLAKALAKHFGARLLIVDSLLLPGVSFSDFIVQFASLSRIYFQFLKKIFLFSVGSCNLLTCLSLLFIYLIWTGMISC